MCGRYVAAKRKGDDAVPLKWRELFDLLEGYNISPGQVVPILRPGDVISRARWGFPQPGQGLLINARIETAAKLPTFRDAFKSGRCIIPASGWYEWRRSDKQPFYLYPKSTAIGFAGLVRPFGDDLEMVICTREPRAEIARIHDRMPVALACDDWEAWLQSAALTDPPVMMFHAVRKRKQAENDASLIAPVVEERGLFE